MGAETEKPAIGGDIAGGDMEQTVRRLPMPLVFRREELGFDKQVAERGVGRVSLGLLADGRLLRSRGFQPIL